MWQSVIQGVFYLHPPRPAVLHASLMPFAHILITDPEGRAVYKFLHLSATFFQNYTAQLNAG